MKFSVTVNNSLGLAIPELSPTTKTSFNTTPRKVSAWIQDLPVTNIGNTAKAVFSAITEINQLDIPPMNRIKAIELFRPTINYIIDNLEKHYLNIPFPLSVKARKVAHLCQKLNSEMSVSYKIVIEQLLQLKGEKFDKKMMIIALHRCTHYLGKVIYQGALVYEPTPQNTWKELHRIYLFAEKYQLHIVPVKDTESKNKDAAPECIEDIYKRLLMLALIDPHHLRQRETQEACLLFEEWCRNVHLVPITETNKTAEKYFINLWSDMPPTHFLTEGNLQLVRGIDIRTIIQHLKSHLDSSHDASGLSSAKLAINNLTKKSLFQSLINSLTGSKQRTFPRKEGSDLFSLTLNVQHAHDYLASAEPKKVIENHEPLDFVDPFANDEVDEDWFDQQFQKKVEEEHNNGLEDLTISGLSMMPKDQTFAMQSDVDMDNPFLAAQAKEKAAAAKPKTEDKPLYQCTTINESAGGYCFTWSDSSPCTQIGELVGIVTEGNRSLLKIGIVRWIKHPIGKELQFGVEMIAPSAIKAITNRQNQQNNDKSLLLPEIKVVNQEATLLTQAMQYKPGTVLTVNTEASNMKVKIKDEIESTSAFTRYRFDILESDTDKTNTINQADDKDDDLDSLWSML